MKININVTDMSPEEARDFIPAVLGLMKNPKVKLHPAPTEVKMIPAGPVIEDEPEQPAEASQEPQEQPQKAAAEEVQAPAEEKPQVSRRDAKSAAVRKIQAGHKDAVKALINSYAASGKVDDIPEEKLGEFVAKVAEIGA